LNLDLWVRTKLLRSRILDRMGRVIEQDKAWRNSQIIKTGNPVTQLTAPYRRAVVAFGVQCERICLTNITVAIVVHLCGR